MNTKIAAIQGILGVKQDGVWGPISQGVFDELVRPSEVVHVVKASTFADPKDVESFRKCKAQGKSDQECFEVGDNGIGYWGDDTTGVTPCCALHKSHIIQRWGSLDAGKHKLVEVAANDTRTICVLKDICGVIDRVDLNPGACAALGLKAGDLVSATWKWAS